MKKVTGIGGVFFKSTDPKATADWYRENLGLAPEVWGGHTFQWREHEDPDEQGYTVWCPFPSDSKKFEATEHPYLVNYRVHDLVALLAELKAAGVEITGDLEEHENGKFAWIKDPDGRAIELWEPVPSKDDPYL